MSATPDHPPQGVTCESSTRASGDRPGAHITETAALAAIQAVLDGVEWTPDSLDAIATILVEAGYPVRDIIDEVTVTLTGRHY
jgi:hypothetical protein